MEPETDGRMSVGLERQADELSREASAIEDRMRELQRKADRAAALANRCFGEYAQQEGWAWTDRAMALQQKVEDLRERLWYVIGDLERIEEDFE